MVEHHARFNFNCALFDIKRQHIADVFGVVNDQACASGLTALTGAPASRHNGHTEVSANGHGSGNFMRKTRHKNTHRFDLINGGVGSVSTTIGRTKQNFALRF